MNEEDWQVELELTIQKINDDLKELVENTMREEVVVGEVENIILKDISVEVLISPDELIKVTTVTHRMGFNLVGEKGQFLNVVTFHSNQINTSENDVYIPYDYKLHYESDEVNISSIYKIDGAEKELSDFLHKIDYYDWFSTEYKNRMMKILEGVGYTIELTEE